MGGELSVDFLAPSGSGENTLVRCEHGDYAADAEIARAIPRAAEFPERARRARGDRDAGRDDDRGAGRVPRHRPRRDVEGDAGREGRRDARARARPRRRPARASRSCSTALSGGSRPATDDEIRAAFGAGAARSARSASTGEVIADETLARGTVRRGREPRRLPPARRRGRPRLRAAASPTSASRARATAARSAAARSASRPRSRSGTSSTSATYYSERLEATFLDEDGREKPLLGGSYGIGPGAHDRRVVEQHHDENGIAVAGDDRAVRRARRRAARAWRSRPSASPPRSRRAGSHVLLDDRDERARARSSPTPT